MTPKPPRPAHAKPPRGRRRPPQPVGPRLREIDKPIISSFGPKQHANRDFVTGRVARNRRRAWRLLMAFALLLAAAAAAGWWMLTNR